MREIHAKGVKFTHVCGLAFFDHGSFLGFLNELGMAPPMLKKSQIRLTACTGSL